MRLSNGMARVISAPDSSMYDALARGLRAVEGDVYFYLNAGDLLMPGAIEVAAEVFARWQPYWVCGLHTLFTREGAILRTRLPYRYHPDWIRRGVYGRGLPFIQQESTFWSRAAMKSVDLDVLASYRYAGDHYLWSTFAQVGPPQIIQAALGGFRLHGNHLSEDWRGYQDEVMRTVERRAHLLNPRVMIERAVWRAPDRVKIALNRGIVRYNIDQLTWSREQR